MSRQWRSVYGDPPEPGFRVECFAHGWDSVPQGVIDVTTNDWLVWFGSELIGMRPTIWRELPKRPTREQVMSVTGY